MKVNNELLVKWNSLYDFGDKKLIAKHASVSYPMVLKALKGDASEKLIVKIDEYYEDKKTRLTKNLNK